MMICDYTYHVYHIDFIIIVNIVRQINEYVMIQNKQMM